MRSVCQVCLSRSSQQRRAAHCIQCVRESGALCLLLPQRLRMRSNVCLCEVCQAKAPLRDPPDPGPIEAYSRMLSARDLPQVGRPRGDGGEEERLSATLQMEPCYSQRRQRIRTVPQDVSTSRLEGTMYVGRYVLYVGRTLQC